MYRTFRHAARATTIALAFVAAFATTAHSAAAGSAARVCSAGSYSYAGLIAAHTATGVKATVTATTAPLVANGHVAGWIGVGGPGRGANGQDAWLQIGINSVPGTGNVVYAEAWIPGTGQVYKALGEVAVGTEVRLAVYEMPGKPGWWRASLNGRLATMPVYLPGSHNAWEPMLIAESWSGGGRACNDFTYEFGSIQITNGRGWSAMRDPSTVKDKGYRLSKRTPSGFSAGRQS